MSYLYRVQNTATVIGDEGTIEGWQTALLIDAVQSGVPIPTFKICGDGEETDIKNRIEAYISGYIDTHPVKST